MSKSNTLYNKFLAVLIISIIHINTVCAGETLVRFNYEDNPTIQKIIYDYLIKKDTTKYDYPFSYSNIGLFAHDINNDGVKEIFVYVNHVGYCGSHGCTFMILKPKIESPKNFEDFEEINFFGEDYKGGITSYNYILILEEKTKNFNNLMLYANDYTKSTGSNLVHVVYEWHGKYYDKTKMYPAG